MKIEQLIEVLTAEECGIRNAETFDFAEVRLSRRDREETVVIPLLLQSATLDTSCGEPVCDWDGNVITQPQPRLSIKLVGSLRDFMKTEKK